MIADADRSGWFGASDAAQIMGRWNTGTFARWWMQKLGLSCARIATGAMYAGAYYEHPILRTAGAEEMDGQLYVPEVRLRVNLDGNTGRHIYEVKTHRFEKPYRPPRAHIRQVNVQLWAARQNGWEAPTAEILAYGLLPYEYENFFQEIDPARLARFPVAYDAAFLAAFLRRLRCLSACLVKGVWPDESGI